MDVFLVKEKKMPARDYSGVAGCFTAEAARDRGKLVANAGNTSPTFVRAMMRYKESGDARVLYQ